MVLMMAVRGGLRPPTEISKTASNFPASANSKIKWTLANVNNIACWIGWDWCSA
jgi:hypothetical protein